MIKVTYYYSACVTIVTPDLSILCDPWFTPGAYDGSWHLWPPYPLEQALEDLPRCDYVYISHVHPDHYDPAFLRRYLQRNPKAIILITHGNAPLEAALQRDGVGPVVNSVHRGFTWAEPLLSRTPLYDQDSALAIRTEDVSVVNVNDCRPSMELAVALRDACDGRSPDIALIGYSAAGPWPQTYYDREVELSMHATVKKRLMLERYLEWTRLLNARANVPFAGQYVLGGRLWPLNPYRGVYDATELLPQDPRAIVLDTGGTLDTDLGVTRPRTTPLPDPARPTTAPFPYERMPDVSRAPWTRMMESAARQAGARSPLVDPYYFIIEAPNGWHVINAEVGRPFSHGISGPLSGPPEIEPRSEITIDPRLLFMLITGLMHWNSAQIGSHFTTHRVPDVFNRDAEAFLYNFHV